MSSLIMISIITFNSFLMTILFYPMVMLFMTVTQAWALCLFLKMNLPSSWLSILLFLIFIGGLMVLFSYIMSLSPNYSPPFMKMNMVYPQTFFYFIVISSFSTLLLWMNLPFNNHLLNIKEYMTFTDSLKSSNALYSLFNKMFSLSSSMLLITMASFLLLALLVATFMVLNNSGPLRKTFKSLN